MIKKILVLFVLVGVSQLSVLTYAADIAVKSTTKPTTTTTSTTTSTKQPLSEVEKMQLQMQGILDKQGNVVPTTKELTATAPPVQGNSIYEPVTIQPVPTPTETLPQEVRADSNFQCPTGYYCKATNGGFTVRCLLGNPPVTPTGLQFSYVNLSDCNQVANMCRAMQNDPSIKNPEVWGAYCKD